MLTVQELTMREHKEQLQLESDKVASTDEVIVLWTASSILVIFPTDGMNSYVEKRLGKKIQAELSAIYFIRTKENRPQDDI